MIRQSLTLPTRYRMTGTMKLPNAATVYSIPRETAPRLPTCKKGSGKKPSSGTAKFLYVLIPINYDRVVAQTKVDERKCNAHPYDITSILSHSFHVILLPFNHHYSFFWQYFHCFGNVEESGMTTIAWNGKQKWRINQTSFNKHE